MEFSEPMFHVPPFPSFPSTKRYVGLGPVDEAFQRVNRGIDSREGILLVMGPSGTGKSLLASLLSDAFEASRTVVMLGDVPLESSAGFYRQLLHRSGFDIVGLPAEDLHMALVDHLRRADHLANGLLLVVDEAQSLSAEVLEAIRMVTNIMGREQPRVTAVLCGGPKLDETLALPALEPLCQRVATRCYLHPLNADETRGYLHESIRACGAEPAETISDEAVAAIHHASAGVPRLINQLMTEVIDGAESAGETLISESLVDAAWARLQQLPSPMIVEKTLASTGSGTSPNPVEFGELDESAPAHAAEVRSHAAEAQPDWEPQPVSNSLPEGDEAVLPVDEACYELTPEPIAATTPPLSDLFGDYEQEEELVVGRIPQFAKSNLTVPSASDTFSFDVSSISAEPTTGVPADAAELTLDPAESLEQEPEPVAESVSEDDEISLPAVEEWFKQSRGAAAPDSTRIDAADMPAPSAAILASRAAAGLLVRDDSDLLIVEDDLDSKHRVAHQHAVVTDDAPAVGVDFQSLINNLRAGR